MNLRSYQNEAVEATLSAFRTDQAALMVLPTGLGKTVVFCELARLMMDASAKRVMVIAHRDELIWQAAEKIKAITHMAPDIEMADLWAPTDKIFGAQPVVSSIQSLIAGKPEARYERFDPNHFSLIIIDEAHHAPSASYQRVIDHFKKSDKCRIFGVTATPIRKDGAGLGHIFDTCSYKRSMSWAIDQGWLTPIRQSSIYVREINLTAVRSVCGDLHQGQLAEIMRDEVAALKVAKPILEEGADRSGIIFCSSVAHAEVMERVINTIRPKSAAVVHGKTNLEERREEVARLKDGRLQYFVNCGVATEGFDAPRVGSIHMARPTMSLSLYTQMLGRGTRSFGCELIDDMGPEGRKRAIAASPKPSVQVLDFVGNAGRHNLVDAIDVLAGEELEPAVRAKCRELAREGDVDVIEVVDAAKLAVEESEAERKRLLMAERRTRYAEAKVKYAKKTVNPFSVFGMPPPRAAQSSSPLPTWQRNMLDKAEIDCSRLTNTEQRAIVKQMLTRRKRGMASYKQVRLLKSYGYERADHMTFDKAGELITAIAENGWKPLGG